MEDKICTLDKKQWCSSRCEDGSCMLSCYSQEATCEYAIVPAKAKELGTTPNTGSPKLPLFKEMMRDLGWERLDVQSDQVAHVANVVYKYIERQLRAGA